MMTAEPSEQAVTDNIQKNESDVKRKHTDAKKDVIIIQIKKNTYTQNTCMHTIRAYTYIYFFNSVSYRVKPYLIIYDHTRKTDI